MTPQSQHIYVKSSTTFMTIIVIIYISHYFSSFPCKLHATCNYRFQITATSSLYPNGVVIILSNISFCINVLTLNTGLMKPVAVPRQRPTLTTTPHSFHNFQTGTQPLKEGCEGTFQIPVLRLSYSVVLYCMTLCDSFGVTWLLPQFPSSSTIFIKELQP